MTDHKSRFSALRERLESRGIGYWYVRNQVLPTWWKDEFLDEDSGFRQACTLISRALDLNLRLMLEGKTVEFNASPIPLYKKSPGKSESDIELASRAAVAASKLAIGGVSRGYAEPPASGLALREKLAAVGEGVRLEGLLEFCWTAGIPVLYAPELPGKKMDALAVSHGGRPAIVISKAEKFRSRLAFMLAHELGHIASGHTARFAVIPDQTIDRDSVEDMEQEANRFALELLYGSPDPVYKTASTAYPDKLAHGAEKLGAQQNVDPAAIVNNWSYHEHKKRQANDLPKSQVKAVYGTATSALRHGIDHEDGLEMLKEYACRFLDPELMPKDTRELFGRITEVHLAA